MSAAAPSTSTLPDDLAGVVGREQVLTDADSTSLYAQDVHTKDLPALAVVRPGSTAELAEIVRLTAAAGHAVIARGGGMSYTSGYVPKEEGSVIVDVRRMDRVLEINRDDMYVTVECGCTWAKLHGALKGTGLRTPFWGTLSGIRATVGGGVSQNGMFWGSARYGSVADSVLSLTVVLADGRTVRTGSAALANGSPFFRHYGPDLTGLFTCDTGALGFKADVTLRLVPETPARRGLSFAFDTAEQTARAMSAIARADIASECFAFDPYLQQVRMQRDSIVNDVRKLAGVAKASGSVMGALRDSAKLAMAGRGYMKDVKYSLHVLIEERIDAAAEHNAAEVRRLAEAENGRELEDSIPKVLRANPFTPLNNVVGPRGERWVPIHTVIPHSKAVETLAAVQALFDEHAERLDEHGIGVGFLLAVMSTNGFVIEPVFFTPDAMNEIHRDTVEPNVLKSLPGFEANEAARGVTDDLRSKVIDLFRQHGGVHMQIGKAYPYRDGLRPESWRLVDDLKSAVDPSRRVNPGCLGFD